MSLLETVTVTCPYCGEAISISIDTSAGTQHYVEDCQVCCQPIDMHVEIGTDGTLESVQVHRQDS